ncbi:MAG: hypothetical protein AB7I18_00990 [Candidatus Berkiella sp.]
MTILIARLESAKLFRHPLTQALIALTIGLFWLFYYRLLVDYLSLMQNALVEGSRHASLSLEVIKPSFSWSIVIFSFILPIFTTFAFSVETQQKTFYLWAIERVSPWQLVFGKFLCLVGVTLLVLLGLLLMICLLQLDVMLDWGMILGGSIAFMGTSCALISFGLFISALCPLPLLAIGITVIGNCLWLLIDWLSPFHSLWLSTADLSLLGHSFHLVHGHFQSQDIAFYFLFTAFWLLLSSRVITYKMKKVH